MKSAGRFHSALYSPAKIEKYTAYKEENKDAFSKTVEDGLIFKSVGKLKVVSHNAANKQLHCGIKEECHRLPCTHASVLLHAGFNIHYVSERLGRESITCFV
ncbi:hypothetical protein [Lysinibacillus sp. 3P01SB]|uniref:hypothetical protein n=1 Tax=Lysinibacillus sp. 3P01SB TaxID=3132284 RepID=UPI0039A416E8